MELGLACTVCGQLNLIRAQNCSRCANIVAPTPMFAASAVPMTSPAPHPAPHAAVPAPTPATASGSIHVAPTSAGPARFDPTTGRPLAPDDDKPVARTMFFGALQQENVTPRLVVIKGEGGDGTTFHLTGTTHVVGRTGGDITFAEDVFLSPEHAKFSSQHGRLFVQDVGSTNGVFIRIKRPVALAHGDCFLVGEQLLRIDSEALPDFAPNELGTYFYGSPRDDAAFRVVQLLAGGGEGLLRSANGRTMSIGREGNVLDFPQDRFISGHHAQLDVASDSDQILLTDTGSRNGTFVKIHGAQELHHGDYLFVGQQLFRVEIS